MIIVVFGLPGSGKSYFAERLANRIGAQYINSDGVRMKMFPFRTYSQMEKNAVYEEMLRRMKIYIDQNKDLVLDATFHLRANREEFIRAAGYIFFIEVVADESIITQRLEQKRVTSEADLNVYVKIKSQWEPFDEPHLVLQSETDNIESMLAKTLNILSYSHDHSANK